jgi:hypothetical protein
VSPGEIVADGGNGQKQENAANHGTYEIADQSRHIRGQFRVVREAAHKKVQSPKVAP